MTKLGRFGTATVLGLVFSLVLCTTGAFAQSTCQNIDRGQISVSAHTAVGRTVAQTITRALLGDAVQHSNKVQDDCRNRERADGCHGFNGCWHGDDCSHSRSDFRCISQRECRTIQVCHSTRWGRACRGMKTCRFRSACRRCFHHDRDDDRDGEHGGWNEDG